MSSHHHHDKSCSHDHSLYAQNLDELDFQRSIHNASLIGNISQHYATRSGKLEICRLLLEHGANVNAVTPELLSTPLHRAAIINNSEIVHLLLSSGANPKLKDSDGHTPLDKARKNGSEDVILILKKFDETD
ncbi:ankyrin repeat-containing domain protein [Gigaspora rosea]|uniref:Ankyrin repeat-containing domain protein n=1 Tax=Gigaspora rosea TaxID=44941 RepID=A0A397VTA8_9GLOM|nr:ankyrin repeat-containing domain protein [Gigaspora rosea]